MKASARLAAAVVLLLGLVAVAGATASAKHYVCDPCSSPCDKTVYDKPGTCPKCGMPLVDQAMAAAHVAATPAAKKVGILIFDGVEIIDYTGPWEMFGAAGFDVYTVAEAKAPVTTAMGMTVVPSYTFADAPQPDVLLIPGGGVRAAQDSAPTLGWIKKMSEHAVHTMSVCNGAFILAGTGLLDGLTATTTAGNIDRMRSAFPKVKVVDDQRVVDNGKIMTAGGLSAGIDGALHVVARMLGNGTAQQVALGEEYDWHPEGGFARAALADRLIPDINLDELGHWDVVSTQGGTDRWAIVVTGSSSMTAVELMDRIGRELTAGGKWSSAGTTAARAANPMTSDWKFTGRDGKPWTGTLTIEGVPGKDHQYNAKLTIARIG
jgi:putative intracellular protease/amidase